MLFSTVVLNHKDHSFRGYYFFVLTKMMSCIIGIIKNRVPLTMICRSAFFMACEWSREEGSFIPMKKVPTALLVLTLLTIILLPAGQTKATLGESSDSVASDQKSLSAVRRATTIRRGYTVQEITADSTTVREYIAPSGVVFGIAWNGLVYPDLTPLLGAYASEYQEALRRTPRNPGRRSLQVRTNQVVVEKWGHMRNLRGRAYLPALVPLGVSVNEIK